MNVSTGCLNLPHQNTGPFVFWTNNKKKKNSIVDTFQARKQSRAGTNAIIQNNVKSQHDGVESNTFNRTATKPFP